MLCRLCIFECGADEGVNIFGNGFDSHLNKLIEKYLHLKILKDDSISTMICSSCLQHLRNSDEFFDYIKQRQLFVETVYMENGNNIEIAIDPLSETKSIGSLTDIGDEFSTESKDMTNNEANLEPLKAELVESTVDCLEKKDEKTSFSKVEKGNLKVFVLNSKKIPKKSDKSQSAKTDENEKYIEEHFQLKCKICREISKTFKHFQEHFRQKHNCPAYIKCCGTHLYTKYRMVRHIQKHVNPNLFKCEICNKKLSSQSSLESHIGSFHTDKEKLPHVCVICGERFTTHFILRSHMLVHEKAENYACEICNKTFKYLRSAKRHKKLQHGNNFNHVCELCGKNYKYKQIFEQHMADKHNIISKDTMKYCEECKSWFSTKYYNKHIDRHELKDVECKFCAKTYPSKVALDKHLDGHYRKKKCQICGSIFNQPKDLREHLKTHAGTTEASVENTIPISNPQR